MEILTSTGYKPLEDITSSDLLVSYDTYTGDIIYNHLIKKEKWTHDMYPPQYNGEGELVYTSEEYFDLQYGGWIFYTINDTWTLFHLESIWVDETNIVHVNQLNIGDTIYNDQDQPIIITKIEQTSTPLEWWKLSISGDHSYIADDLILHNASRYWVGGGSSANWNATANTNWASTSGGANNASVPGSADDVFFDGAGTNGNTNCTATGADCLTFTRSDGYTANITVPASTNWNIRGNITISNGAGFTIVSGGTSSNIQHFNTATISMGGKTIGCGWIWNTGTKTLSGSDLAIVGGISAQLSATVNNTTSESVIAGGGIGMGGYTLSGNADIIVTGGTISGNFGIVNNIYISGGTVSLGSFLRKDGGIIRYYTGTVNAVSDSNVRLNATPTILDTSGTSVNFRNLTITSSCTNCRLDSPASITGTTIVETGVNFSGSAGFTTASFSSTTTTAQTIAFNTGGTFNITSAMVANTSRVGSILTFSGVSSTNRSKLFLNQGATCNVLANFTNIDASSGRTINTFNGTVTNSLNVRSFTDIPTYGSSYVM